MSDPDLTSLGDRLCMAEEEIIQLNDTIDNLRAVLREAEDKAAGYRTGLEAIVNYPLGDYSVLREIARDTLAVVEA